MTERAPPLAAPAGEPATELYEPRSWRSRLRPLTGNPELVVGAGILAAYLLLALSALVVDRGVIPPLSAQPALYLSSLSPSRAHPIGILVVTAFVPNVPPVQYGIDELQMLWQATPVDLGLLAAILVPSATVGMLLGARAGSREGGAVDFLTTGWGDVLIGVPPFLLVAILYVNLATLVSAADSLLVLVVTYLLILWPYYARPVRSQARVIAAQPYVQAAEAAGASEGRVLRRHILPNSIAPVLAQLPADLAGIFLILATFPYLACKFPAFGQVAFVPNWQFPEWGYALGEGGCNGLGVTFADSSWWMYAFPMLAIILFGAAVSLVCDGLQRYLEHTPRTA